jgi:hypothetical protein
MATIIIITTTTTTVAPQQMAAYGTAGGVRSAGKCCVCVCDILA